MNNASSRNRILFLLSAATAVAACHVAPPPPPPQVDTIDALEATSAYVPAATDAVCADAGECIATRVIDPATGQELTVVHWNPERSTAHMRDRDGTERTLQLDREGAFALGDANEHAVAIWRNLHPGRGDETRDATTTTCSTTQTTSGACTCSISVCVVCDVTPQSTQCYVGTAASCWTTGPAYGRPCGGM